MARHWVQETPAETRPSTWSTAPLPGSADEPAEVYPIVPATRRPEPSEVDSTDAATA